MSDKLQMRWQDLEHLIRKVAEAKFGAPARAEDIAGVKCDCVLHLNDGSVVLIEISRESSIKKFRTDLSKFNVLRPHFFKDNIFPRCYFICLDDPTPSIIESGKANHIQVFSITQFLDIMFGHHRYATERKKHAFGSAIDLYSGEPDQKKYIPVTYVSDAGDPYTIEKIANEIINGRIVVLVGDYGSGKESMYKGSFRRSPKVTV